MAAVDAAPQKQSSGGLDPIGSVHMHSAAELRTDGVWQRQLGVGACTMVVHEHEAGAGGVCFTCCDLACVLLISTAIPPSESRSLYS